MEVIISEEERSRKIKGSIKQLHGIDEGYLHKNCTGIINDIESKLNEINSKQTSVGKAESLKDALKQDLLSFTLCITNGK